MSVGQDSGRAADWQDSCPACGTTVPITETSTTKDVRGYRCAVCERLLFLLRAPENPLRVYDTTEMTSDSKAIVLKLQQCGSINDLDSLDFISLVMELED